jgi:hypothetical protein
MDPGSAAASAATGFGHLFSWRHPSTVDLSHAAYRYNQNMMEYYTCKSKFLTLETAFLACCMLGGLFRATWLRGLLFEMALKWYLKIFHF